MLAGHETDGRAHRAIVCDTRRLGDGRDLAWVGFFAVRRRDVDPAPLAVRDDELIQEFPGHPGILSYSSLELGDGDWGNLILLDGDEAREHWRVSERHAAAARDLAPRHYTDVRLHQGALPGGVRAGREAGSAPDEVLRLSRRRRLAGGARVAALRTGRGRRAPG